MVGLVDEMDCIEGQIQKWITDAH